MSGRPSSVPSSNPLSAPEFFCAELLSIWHSTRLDMRPPVGVWLSRHEPVSAPDYNLVTDVIETWFLGEGKISRRNPSEFLRFVTVHSTRPWATGMDRPPSGIFGSIHQIGVAGFAQVAGTEDYYFQYQFGGCFGRGDIYHQSPDGQLHCAQGVYIS